MRYSLVINGHEIGNFIAGDGVSVSYDERNSKEVITMDGTKFKKSKTKRNFDITLLDMPDSYFYNICSWIKLADPATVSYTDFDQGTTLTNRLFYVKLPSHQASEVIDSITYLTGISFSMEER